MFSTNNKMEPHYQLLKLPPLPDELNFAIFATATFINNH